MREKDIIERIKQSIALFERETGRVPTIDQLASELGMDVAGVRKAIQKYLSDSKLEGTSAFQKSLLEILMNPTTPLVARIMDYDRFKFEAEKRAREAKRKYRIVDVKEIKMRYEIDDNDYQVKLRHAQKFLNNGDKIKVQTILRGREIQHKDLAVKLMGKFAHELKKFGMIIREPELEGKTLVMILSPLSRSGH